MEVFLPGIGLIVGLISLVAAVRMTEQQERSARMAVVERRVELPSERWTATTPK